MPPLPPAEHEVARLASPALEPGFISTTALIGTENVAVKMHASSCVLA